MKKVFDEVAHEENYVEFLRKRIQSDNYRQNVSKEEFEKTERKYDKAKLKLKMMKEQKSREGDILDDGWRN